MAEFLKFFDTNRKLKGVYGTLRLEWFISTEPQEGSSKRIQASSDYNTQKKMAIKSSMLCAMLIFLLLQVYTLPGHIRYGNLERILAWLTISLFCIYIMGFNLMWIKASDIANSLNGLIQFDEKYGKEIKRWQKCKFPEMLYIYVAYLGPLSTIAIPVFFVIGLHWLNPWKVSLIGYWLIPRYVDPNCFNRLIILAVKLIVILPNCWVWGVGVEPPAFSAAVIQNLAPGILRDNISLFERYCENLGKLTITKRANIFRQLQILVGLVNEVQRGPLILLLIVAPTTVLAFSVATLVKTGITDIALLLTFLYLCLICGILIIIIFGGMSKVHVKSSCILQLMRRRLTPLISRIEQKWEWKFYKSCSPLKLMITPTNFVDQLTPLNMLQYSMSLSTNVLLILWH